MLRIIYQIMILVQNEQLDWSDEGPFENFIINIIFAFIAYVVMIILGIFFVMILVYCLLRLIDAKFSQPSIEKFISDITDQTSPNKPNDECPACRCWDALEANGRCRYCNIENR